jgi:ABC-2 type transport system ATP-binding protein
MEEAERLCQRVGVVDHGQLLACGTRRELVALVGQHDQLTFTLADEATRAAEVLSAEPGVLTATDAGDRTVTCMAASSGQLLPALIAALAAADLTVTNLAVAEPSLDSVFLQLTGTALRD